MTFEEAKQRADYSFTLNGIEDLIPGIRKNWMEAMDEDSVTYDDSGMFAEAYLQTYFQQFLEQRKISLFSKK